jgi:hypothetical protein
MTAAWEERNNRINVNNSKFYKSSQPLPTKLGSNYCGAQGAVILDNARATLAPSVGYNGSPVFPSEFAGIAWIPSGAKVPEALWGYAGVEKSSMDALARLRSLYEAIARTPALIGIRYTQLTDVEQEVNGLLTYDRKPKFDAKAFREINNMVQ